MFLRLSLRAQNGRCVLVRYILLAPLLVLSFVVMAAIEGPQKIIISAGALDNSGLYDAFYQSRIFVSQNQAPFVISNAQTQAFAAHGAVFYGDKLSPENIIKASLKSRKLGRISGVEARSFAALPLHASEHKLSESLSDYMGAISLSYYYEIRELASGEKIYSFSKEAINWPTQISEIKSLPAVVIEDSTTKSPILVVARALGAWEQKLALVDQLMKDPKYTYIDIGINESTRLWAADREILQAVAQRKPAALMLGTAEMASLAQDAQSLAHLPVIYPFGDSSTRGSAHLKFWSVAGEEKLWPLFASLGSLKRVTDATALMRKQNPRALNIVRVFSQAAALEAAKSAYVDIVLVAVDHELAQLPSQEIIEVKKGEVAPIVRISALDVSEVLVQHGRESKKVQIIRHAALSKNFEGSYYKPAQHEESLPSLGRLWTTRDFDCVLAGMMIEQSQADVAIFESEKTTTPISGPLDYNIARARLLRPGNVATAVFNGKQLKDLASMMAKKALTNNYVIFGFDPKTRQIRGRALNDAEKFKVAMSEKALLEIWGVAMLGGFSEEYAQRSIFAEQIGAKVTSLFFLSGIKKIATTDTLQSLRGALNNFKARQSFDSLLSTQLSTLNFSQIETFINKPAGEAGQSLTLGIDYLDIGFSQTFGNDTYKNGLKDKKFALISRGAIPLHAHILLFFKASLIYDTPYVELNLGSNIKYLHMDQAKQPERDKVIFTLDFRLPWERSLFKEKSIIISPILRNYYETKIGALPFLAAPNQEKAKPRTQIVTSLLGTNVNFTNLGFNFDIGGMMGVDFNQISALEATTFGPAFNFTGKWTLYGPLEVSSILKAYYLFGLPGSYRDNRIALGVEGTTWLRVARFYDFNVSLMADFFAASLQGAQREIAVSSIVGLTISYGRFFRLFG